MSFQIRRRYLLSSVHQRLGINVKYLILNASNNATIKLIEWQIISGLPPLRISRASALQQHSKHTITLLIDENEFTFYASGAPSIEKKWVQIELVEESTVHYIKIRNRRDCCGERFSNAQIRVGNNKVLKQSYEENIELNELCETFPGKAKTGQMIDITCSSPLRGKFVTIQILDPTVKQINLAEVEIFGRNVVVKNRCKLFNVMSFGYYNFNG